MQPVIVLIKKVYCGVVIASRGVVENTPRVVYYIGSGLLYGNIQYRSRKYQGYFCYFIKQVDECGDLLNTIEVVLHKN